METSRRTSMPRILSQGKSGNLIAHFIVYRLQFMKVLNKYWDSDLCLTKVKVGEKLKTLGFDSKN